MYYDLLAGIKNAERAERASVTTPYSRIDFAVAKILVAAGYLKDAQKRVVGRRAFLDIKLSRRDGPAVRGFKIVSKPSRHIYVRSGKVRAVKQGYGLGVLSTSKGVMSDEEARKLRLGGEYLFEIW